MVLTCIKRRNKPIERANCRGAELSSSQDAQYGVGFAIRLPVIRVGKLGCNGMVRDSMLIAMCIMLAVATGCATNGRAAPLPTLDEIVRMSVDGAADDEIITRLKKSGAVYPLSASQIIDLSGKGVSTAVLDYMQARLVDSVRRDGHLLNGEPFWGYPCQGCSYPSWRVQPYNFPY